MITRDQVLRNARFAGMVERYHTWPTLQRQTVADHTFHLFRIFFTIWGPLPPDISTWFIWHDVGELVTGDPPFPVKARNPDLKEVHDRIERDAVIAMGGVNVQLSEHDKVRTKICDLVEMWEWGLLELQLGNKYGQPIVRDIETAVMKLCEKLPAEDRERLDEYVFNMTKALGA